MGADCAERVDVLTDVLRAWVITTAGVTGACREGASPVSPGGVGGLGGERWGHVG